MLVVRRVLGKLLRHCIGVPTTQKPLKSFVLFTFQYQRASASVQNLYMAHARCSRPRARHDLTALVLLAGTRVVAISSSMPRRTL